MQRLFTTLAAVGLLATVLPTASACINDHELASHEKEFKSQYLRSASDASGSSSSGFAERVVMITISAAGGALLLAAAIAGGRWVIQRR